MIRPEETEIRCQWKVDSGKVVATPQCDRIDTLTKSYLHKVTSDPSGWDKLYRDPQDGRLWELTYPLSHMHGGGPPLLKIISESDARQKYKF